MQVKTDYKRGDKVQLNLDGTVQEATVLGACGVVVDLQLQPIGRISLNVYDSRIVQEVK